MHGAPQECTNHETPLRADAERYFVLDTNVILHQMDFLENEHAASILSGVIVLAVRIAAAHLTTRDD